MAAPLAYRSFCHCALHGKTIVLAGPQPASPPDRCADHSRPAEAAEQPARPPTRCRFESWHLQVRSGGRVNPVTAQRVVDAVLESCSPAALKALQGSSDPLLRRLFAPAGTASICYCDKHDDVQLAAGAPTSFPSCPGGAGCYGETWRVQTRADGLPLSPRAAKTVARQVANYCHRSGGGLRPGDLGRRAAPLLQHLFG